MAGNQMWELKMNGPTPINPTPTAVPWTPDMGAQQNQPIPVSLPIPVAPHPQAPMAAPQAPVAPVTAQPFQPQPTAVQPAAQHPMQHSQPAPARPSIPSAHPHQAQPYNPVAQQPAYQQPQQPQQMSQGRYIPPAQAPQYAQAAPPPMLPPHMQAPGQIMSGQGAAATQSSNSLFAKLFKRSPKPEAAGGMFEKPAPSTSLFNKNFVLGGIVGFIGAFALMTGLNTFTTETPQKSQKIAAHTASSDLVPAPQNTAAPNAGDGGTFLDDAIAKDAP